VDEEMVAAGARLACSVGAEVQETHGSWVLTVRSVKCHSRPGKTGTETESPPPPVRACLVLEF
jgi:hypothetical protein